MSILLVMSTARAAEPPILGGVDGAWRVPLRYWSHEYPFQARGSITYLVEVSEIGAEPKKPTENDWALRFQSGRLRVLESLSPQSALSKQLSSTKFINVEGVEGLKKGDRLIVFIDTVPYEGFYVMNYRTDGCHIGIKLPPADDLNFGAKEQAVLLTSCRSGNSGLRDLSSEQLQAWIDADPAGVALAFKQELEAGGLVWKPETTK